MSCLENVILEEWVYDQVQIYIRNDEICSVSAQQFLEKRYPHLDSDGEFEEKEEGLVEELSDKFLSILDSECAPTTDMIRDFIVEYFV